MHTNCNGSSKSDSNMSINIDSTAQHKGDTQTNCQYPLFLVIHRKTCSLHKCIVMLVCVSVCVCVCTCVRKICLRVCPFAGITSCLDHVQHCILPANVYSLQLFIFMFVYVCVCEIPWQKCMSLMHACSFNPHVAESALKSTTKHMAYVCIWSNQHGDILGSAQLHNLFLTLKDFMVPCCTLREITFVAIHKTEDSSRFCKL